MAKGSTFEQLLEEKGIKDEVYTSATKRVLAWQISEAMKEEGLTKMVMALRMGTSRTQLDRLLDPENDKVQLDTIEKAAKALGRSVRLELI
jgi:antitoxin HicB